MMLENNINVNTCILDELGLGTPELSRQLRLPILRSSEEIPPACTHVLHLGKDGMSLSSWPAQGKQAPTRVDFNDATLLHRLKTSGKRQGLGKALGLAKNDGLQVLDATAGLGRDALLMAYLGCAVTMLERSLLVHALLQDGLARASITGDPLILPALQRMQLHLADARQWFAYIAAGLRPRPEVIYLDPMFPPRDKTAKVKKDIALLQELLGAEMDFKGLLDAACAVATKRVVVKRPAGKVDAALPVPAFTVPGKTASFDVYLASSSSSMCV